MARQPAAALVLGALLVIALSADGGHGQAAAQNAAETEQLAASSDPDSESDPVQLLSTTEELSAPQPPDPPTDNQDPTSPTPVLPRVTTLYTTFTFINRFVKYNRPVAITTSETISSVLSLAGDQTAPSGTTRRTETFLTTYTYYKTEAAASQGGRPRVTSTEEVTTQVVVTEAAQLPPVVPRPTAIRPVVLTTMAPQQPAGSATLLTPSVEPSVATDEDGLLRNSVVMAATRTFYTTSTFYTTLVEGGSTVVRSRTELTSRVQTELSTTWLEMATTAIRPIVRQTVTWLGNPGQVEEEPLEEEEQEMIFLTPVQQTTSATVTKIQLTGGNSNPNSAQNSETASQTAASSTDDAASSAANAASSTANVASSTANEASSTADVDSSTTDASSTTDEASSTAATAPSAATAASATAGTAPSAVNAASSSSGASEEDKNAVLLAIQALVAEADEENTGEDRPASAPTALIPDTVISSPGSLDNIQLNFDSQTPELADAVATPSTKPPSPKPTTPEATKVVSEAKPVASKVKATSKPVKDQTQPTTKPVKQQSPAPTKPTKPQAPAPVKPTKATIPAPTKPTKAEEAATSEPVKAETTSKPVTVQKPTPSQFLVAPAPVAAPTPPVTTVQTSVQTSTSTLVSESSSFGPGLGGLAGGLLGLGGLAAGLIRNVIPLPLPLRRDGNTGVQAGGSPFQLPRPGGRPGVRPGPRPPFRPGGNRPQGGNRRHEQPINRNDNGYLVVIGPGGQTIPLNRYSDNNQTPPTRRTGYLAPTSSGVQAGPHPQRYPVGGAPIRRNDHQRRPQPGSRPLTHIPPRIDGPRRTVRPGRPSRPPPHPLGRPVGPNQLHRPGRPVSRRPRPHPTGYIAVRPGDPTPPADFRREPDQFQQQQFQQHQHQQQQHGPSAHHEQHAHPPPQGNVHGPRPGPSVHVAPTQPQHGAVRPPPPQHTGHGNGQSLQRPEPHQQHAPNARPQTHGQQGNVRPPPPHQAGGIRPQVVNQHANNFGGPTPHHGGGVGPQPSPHPTRPFRPPPPPDAQRNVISQHQVALQDRPYPNIPATNQAPPAGVHGPRGSAPPPHPETLYREHLLQSPQLQAGALVFKDNGKGPVHPVPGDVAVTSHIPSYNELNSVDQDGPSDDQKPSASLFTNIGPDGTVQSDPEDVEDDFITAPSRDQEKPLVRVTPVLVPTLHTIASVEGPNRIVGTNVFKQVGPLQTINGEDQGTNDRPGVVRPSRVQTIQTTQIVGAVSPSGNFGSGNVAAPPTSGPVDSAGNTFAPGRIATPGFKNPSPTGQSPEELQGFSPDGDTSSGAFEPFGGQFGEKITSAQPSAISNVPDSSVYENPNDAVSSPEEEPVYPDDTEDQNGSSTNIDGIGKDGESLINSVDDAQRVPGAPSLTGLAGINFGGLPVTSSPDTSERVNEANAFNDYGQDSESEYDENGTTSPTVGYDYSEPQYDPYYEETSDDGYPETFDASGRPNLPESTQSYEQDNRIRPEFVLQPNSPSSPGAQLQATNNGIGSINDDLGKVPASTTTDEYGQREDGFARPDGPVAETQGSTNGQDDTTSGLPSSNPQSNEFDDSFLGQQIRDDGDDASQSIGQGQQVNPIATPPPSEETTLSGWNGNPTAGNANQPDWTINGQGQFGDPTSSNKQSGIVGGSDGQEWSQRQPEGGDDHRTEEDEEISGSPSAGQSVGGGVRGDAGWTNGQADSAGATRGEAYPQEESGSNFDQENEYDREQEQPLDSEYESTLANDFGSKPRPDNSQFDESGPADETEPNESNFETQPIRELDTASNTDDSISPNSFDDDNDASEAVTSRPTENPLIGSRRPSASRGPSRRPVRPSITRRPFRGTVRPSGSLGGTSRPPLTRRPFRGTRRPASTEGTTEFTGIKRPAWAQFHENDDETPARPGSDSRVADEKGSETVTDEFNESGLSGTSPSGTNQDLSKPTHQEHDLDLDPSIREEWVQTGSDNDNSADNEKRLPGISLDSSVEQGTGASSPDSPTPGLNNFRLPGRRKPSRRPSLADIIRQTLLSARDGNTLVTVDYSSSNSIVRISSATIAPSRTEASSGIATSETSDSRRVPPGIVRPGLADEQDERAGGLAWPSYDSSSSSGSEDKEGEQDTEPGSSSSDYGPDGEFGDSGWSYGEDYESGTSDPGFGQDYESGTSAPYYTDYYETGTSESAVEGDAQDPQSETLDKQVTDTDGQKVQDDDEVSAEGASTTVEPPSLATDEQATKEGQTEQTSETETAQTETTAQETPQSGENDSTEDGQPKVGISLKVTTSEASQEVSVQHSVSEVSPPTDSASDAKAGSDSPVEVVVGVSSTGGVVADVTEVTTTEEPVSTTARPASTAEAQDVTNDVSTSSEDKVSSSAAPSESPATPVLGASIDSSSGRRPTPPSGKGRGSVAIAGLLVPTQKDHEPNRGVETPGQEQPLHSEDKELEDKCARPCQAAINEACRLMNGEHRCLCRPGFSRARSSDACEPSLTYQVRMLLDRVNDIPLQYRPPFAEPASPEYRQLAELAAGGLRETLTSTGAPLASRLHGAELMAFKRAADLPDMAPSRPQALIGDVMVQITDRESKSLDKDSLQVLVEESLRRVNYSLSDQQVVVSPLHGDVTVIDFDECQNADYNDCHEGAFCFNTVGSFTCSCRDGLVDTGVPSLPGRSCTGEYSGCPECSYSGECYTEPNTGEPACRCHRWYAGQRCQVNLRVLLIALASAGALLAALLCVCCYFCCRRRHGRRVMAAPPLVFSGPGGLWRHRGSRLHQPVNDQRAMLDSSSDTSVPVSSRRRGPNGGKRLLPPLTGGPKPPGAGGSRSSQQQPPVADGPRPSRFLPRPRHKADAPSGPRSLDSQAAPPGRTQPQLLGLLQPADAARGRTAGGTFRAGRAPSRSSSSRPDGEPQVSHTPGGRSRSSSIGRRTDAEVSQLPGGRSRSRSSDSVSAGPERQEYGTHNFFRARTMSDARSFDEELIEPSVRPVARFDTTRSQRSSHAPSSHGYTYEHHTMAERDAASTYVMPETHLFRRAQDSDAQSETSLVEDFPRMDAASTVSSRRGFR